MHSDKYPCREHVEMVKAVIYFSTTPQRVFRFIYHSMGQSYPINRCSRRMLARWVFLSLSHSSKQGARSHKIHFYHLALIILSIFYNTHGVNTSRKLFMRILFVFLRLFTLIDHLKLNGFSFAANVARFINCEKSFSGETGGKKIDELFDESAEFICRTCPRMRFIR